MLPVEWDSLNRYCDEWDSFWGLHGHMVFSSVMMYPKNVVDLSFHLKRNSLNILIHVIQSISIKRI